MIFRGILFSVIQITSFRMNTRLGGINSLPNDPTLISLLKECTIIMGL